MAILTLPAPVGDISVHAPAQSPIGVIGDIARSLSGVLRSDVPATGATFRQWGPYSSTYPLATANAIVTLLRAGVGIPFNVSGDLIGGTISVLAANLSESMDSDATHKTVTFSLLQVTPT